MKIGREVGAGFFVGIVALVVAIQTLLKKDIQRVPAMGLAGLEPTHRTDSGVDLERLA